MLLSMFITHKHIMERISLMSASLALLFSVLFAFAWSANARKDSGDYWKNVMKDEPIPTALEALILPGNNVSPSKSTILKNSDDCGEHHSTADFQVEEVKKLASERDDFEPRPSVTAYVKQDSVRQDFEPRPSLTAYVKQDSARQDFEPRPSVTAYVKQDSMRHDFEPRPSLTAYVKQDSVMSKTIDEEEEEEEAALLKNFEPRPNVSSYHNGDTTVVVVVEEKEELDRVAETRHSFEPRPNVSAYGG